MSFDWSVLVEGYLRLSLVAIAEYQQNLSTKTPEQDFKEFTWSLNLIISRLAYHELRLAANQSILRRINPLIHPAQLGVMDSTSIPRLNYAAEWPSGNVSGSETKDDAL